MDFITHSTVGNGSFSVLASAHLALKSNRGDMMGPNDTHTHTVDCFTEEEPKAQSPELFDQAANIVASRK